MIILSPSVLRISSLVSAKIGDKEESDLSAKRALLESEKIVNRLLSMVPFKISCTTAVIAYSSAVNIEASQASLSPLVVLGNTAEKPTPLVDLEPSVQICTVGCLSWCARKVARISLSSNPCFFVSRNGQILIGG